MNNLFYYYLFNMWTLLFSLFQFHYVYSQVGYNEAQFGKNFSHFTFSNITYSRKRICNTNNLKNCKTTLQFFFYHLHLC